jgi:hypothetical protein
VTSARLIAQTRGEIVRKIATFQDTHAVNHIFQAHLEAAEFNREHPSLAIPAPMQVIGRTVGICPHCRGQGSEEWLIINGLRVKAPSYADAPIEERACEECEGSGWYGVFGAADQARAIKNDNPLRVGLR